MKVNFIKLNDKAVIPTKAHPTDAGFDLTAVSCEYNSETKLVSYGTGIAVAIPKGYVGLIFPRSSIYKTNCTLSNAVGVVDCGYSGEIKFKFRVPDATNYYHIGDRIGQLIIMPYPEIEFEEVEDLGESDRGEGGFGSTGN